MKLQDLCTEIVETPSVECWDDEITTNARERQRPTGGNRECAGDFELDVSYRGDPDLPGD